MGLVTGLIGIAVLAGLFAAAVSVVKRHGNKYRKIEKDELNR